MSVTTENRVENMLANIRVTNESSASTSESPWEGKQLQSSWGQGTSQPQGPSVAEKERLNMELRESQRQMKVLPNLSFLYSLI